MSFLVDTDTCSAHLKTHPLVTNRFLQYTGRLYISTITLGELRTYALRANAPTKRQQALQDLLREVQILDVVPVIADKFGELHAHLLDRGQPMPLLDLFLAATAIVCGHTLVTHNTQDFANVPGLSLTDWLVP